MSASLKEKSAALRRQHILEAAARTFASAGYQRATIHAVAVAAGVADGTIYNSFASKAELLLSLLDPLGERFPAVTSEAAATPPSSPEDLETLLRVRWNALTPDVLDMLRVILSEGLVDTTVGSALMARVLGPAIAPLELVLASSGHPDPAVAARTQVATFLGLAVFKMLGDPVIGADAENVPQRLAAVLAGSMFQKREC
jgi:TetR/AcrR family fatty acid metabolism transcriptional regulator